MSSLEELEKVAKKPSFGSTTYIACASSCGKASENINALEQALRSVYKDHANVIVSLKVETNVKTEKHVDFSEYDLVERCGQQALVSHNALVAVKYKGVVYTTTETKEVVVKPVEHSRIRFAMRSTVLEPLDRQDTKVGINAETRIACAFSSQDVASCILSKTPLEFTEDAMEEYQAFTKGTTSAVRFIDPSEQVSQETAGKPGTRLLWCQPESINPLYFVPSKMESPTHVSGVLHNFLWNCKAVVLLKDLKVCDLPANTKRAIVTPLVRKNNGYKNRATMFQVVLEDHSNSDVLVCTGFPGTARPKKVNLLDNVLKLEHLNFRTKP